MGDFSLLRFLILDDSSLGQVDVKLLRTLLKIFYPSFPNTAIKVKSIICVYPGNKVG